MPPDPADEWLRSIHGAVSPHTERALRSDLRQYRSWCRRGRRNPWPVRATVLARFIDSMARDRAPATVDRQVASLASLCRAMEWKDPRKTAAVTNALGRMRRRRGARQSQAHGLTRPLVERMMAASGDRPIDSRNRALIAVAYDAMLRRSELVSLQVTDLMAEPDGTATLLVRRGKTDPGGRGAVLFLAGDTVDRVVEWLDRSGITRGFLFPSLPVNGSPGGKLDPGQVSRIYKSMARRAGIGEAVIHALSAHSTRVGAAQDMIASGVELPAVMQAGRWKSTAMVYRYGERILASKGGAAQLAKHQNRFFRRQQGGERRRPGREGTGDWGRE